MSKRTSDYHSLPDNASQDFPDLGEPMAMPRFPCHSKIVGNTYRPSTQQSALRNKNQNNRVLIVPEPGNPKDKNALAVLVARGLSSNSFVWTHVGYLPKSDAKRLAPEWPRYKGRLLVGEGRISGNPAHDANPGVFLESSFRAYGK